MHKPMAMADLYPMITEVLEARGCVSLTTTGVSMLPMLCDRRDTVVLEPVISPLHVNDVVLYRRDNGQFVLHRIVGIEANGDYILCGDNQLITEHHIAHRQVIGRLQAFIRKGRRISCTSPRYKAYLYLLPLLRLLKRGFFVGRMFASALRRRIRRLVNGNG